ncbi:UPF0755 protein [Sediminibacterium magnilacihabitans]|jgi:UPF0755 protein|nr:UPF0755 protein [Sediminibacterium magnilacihabitans]
MVMKKILLILLLLFIVTAGIFSWQSLTSGTGFEEKSRYLVVEEGRNTQKDVIQTLQQEHLVKHPGTFSLLATTWGIWNKLKPGKYEIKKGDNLFSIARMLRNNRQASIKLVINKLRVKEDLAHLVGKNFNTDSVAVMNFLQSNDSLKPFGVDTNTVFTLILPDTYSFYWNTSFNKILRKLADTRNAFWSRNDRMQKARQLSFTPEEAYTLASIVEEETNFESDKSKIAGVYINRLGKDMPLQACPTIKYAMKDFTLTRIYEKYLGNPSPYNTYRKKGLPPGPICTPSPKTIDIVLNAPRTDYLYFVAKSDFSGYHHFSSTYEEHMQYAREYQKALDAYMAKKQNSPEH